MMPMVAILSIFSGDIDIDTDRLQDIVIEEMSNEEKAKLQTLEDMMNAIESAMTEKGFTAERTKEAQVLYTLALYDYAQADDFVDKLVSCFTEEQTDAQLIAAVNAAFGTELKAEDYSKVMNSIRAKAINVSKFVDPETKNNVDLAEWAKQAYAKKWGYVYGTYGGVLNDSILTTKISQFPEQVGENEKFIRQHWLGGRTADCIGLIKGYAWFNCDTGQIEYRSNGVRDTGSDPMLDMAIERARLIRCPTSPASPYGWTATSASMSATGKPFTPPTRSWVLL